MKKSAVWLIVLIVAAASCSARCIEKEELKILNVSGTGTVSFIPNMVTISIHVKNVNDRLEDSVRQTKEVISDLLLICKEYGVADTDIKSSYITTNKEYHWVPAAGKQVFDGYSVTQNTDIIFRNVEQLEQFSAELLKLKITSITGMVFDHSERSQYEAEANVAALDNAKKTAEKMAERMNVQLGDVIYIADSDYTENEKKIYAARAYSKSMDVGIIASPGILSASRQVLVRYKIR